MIQDKIKERTIFYLRGLLGKLDLICVPTSSLYNLYYRLVMFFLKRDLRIASNNLKCTKHTFGAIVGEKIWFMWWQGLDSAPLIVKINYKRLKKMFGDEVILITKSNYSKYTDVSNVIKEKVKRKEITFTQWSDILRFNLLKNNGGMWVDSTVVLSCAFIDYYKKVKVNDFFSICSSKLDYSCISRALWTSWLCGGKPGYELFCFMDEFFKVYFTNHPQNIDYFLVDDAIYFYYKAHFDFQKSIKKQQVDWDPYLFVHNFNAKDNEYYINAFNEELKYSVQKFSYKDELSKTPEYGTLFYKILKDDLM